MQILRPLRKSNLVGLAHSPRICILVSFPRHSDADGLWATLSKLMEEITMNVFVGMTFVSIML